MPKRIKRSLPQFLKSALLNVVIFSAAIAVYFFVVRIMQAHSIIFYPLQLLEAKLIYLLQKPFADLALEGTRLVYQDFVVNVSWDCLGIRQSLFFLILVFSFYQADIRSRLWGFVFVPVIFIANILRILILYPYFLLFGFESTAGLHEFIYSYGNGIFILLLLVIWFYVFVYRKYMQRRKKQAI